jgi:hypothetical protein
VIHKIPDGGHPLRILRILRPSILILLKSQTQNLPWIHISGNHNVAGAITLMEEHGMIVRQEGSDGNIQYYLGGFAMRLLIN